MEAEADKQKTFFGPCW